MRQKFDKSIKGYRKDFLKSKLYKITVHNFPLAAYISYNTI